MIEVYIGGRSLASTRDASDPMDLSEGPVLWIIAGWTYLSLQDDCSSNGARHTDTPSWKIDWLSSIRKRSINESSGCFWIPVPFFSSIADHFSMVSTPQTVGILQAVSGDFLGLQSDSNLVEVLRPTMARHGPPLPTQNEQIHYCTEPGFLAGYLTLGGGFSIDRGMHWMNTEHPYSNQLYLVCVKVAAAS